MYRKTVLLKSRSNVKVSAVERTAGLELVSGASPAIEQAGTPVDLRRVRGGDPSAWDEILRRYGKLVSATVRSFRLQEADALDAVQTTWLRLAENADQIQSPERLGGWLTTTARRECLRILHDAKRASCLTDMVADTVTDPSMEPEQRVIEIDVARRLWGLVDELSPRQRSLMRALFTEHSRPYTKVADTTGIPLGAIGPTRRRALMQLRGLLQERQPPSQFSSRRGARLGQAHGEAFAKVPRPARLRRNIVVAHVG